MDDPRSCTDAALSDREWRGYDLRATLPHLTLATALSLLLLIGRWYLSPLSEFANSAGALAVYAMALAVWPGLLAILIYRTVTFTYRLTDRALLVERGFLFRPEPPIWLIDLHAVSSGATWLNRQMGVGWVQLEAAEGRVVHLMGIRDAATFAEQIRKSTELARQHPELSKPSS